MLALTKDSIAAVDVLHKALRLHGNETAAMGDVIVHLRSQWQKERG
jgi:hypothetical protein